MNISGVYVNLPVKDLARSRAFFSALDFGFNDQFSDDTAIAMVINDTTSAMLLTHKKFASFTPRKIADANKTSEVLVALRLSSREDVDKMVATALANGGARVREPEDLGFMYAHAFADPDGHVWEPFWMNPEAMEARQ